MRPSTAATPGAPSFHAKLGTLVLLTTMFYIGFMSRIVLGPMLPTVEADLLINHVRSGSMFFMISLGLSMGAFGSGFVNSRIGHRNTIVIAFLSSGLALAVASRTHSLMQIDAALFFVGAGAGMYLPSALVTITTLISQKNWAKAIAIHEMAPNLGLLLSPVITEILMRFMSWRGVLLTLGLATFLAGLVYAVIGHGGRTKGERPNLAALARVARLPSLWILMALFALSFGGSLAVYNMMSVFLVNEHHSTQETANLILAVSRFSGLFMAFVAGYVSDRLGPRLAIRMVLILTGLFTMSIGILSGWSLVAVLILQGATVACFFPTGFAAVARVCAPHERNLALSLTTPLATLIGGGVVPAGIGYMGDNFTFSAGFVLTGILILLGAVTVRWLRFHDEGR